MNTTIDEAVLTRDRLQPLVNDGWLTARGHPEFPLTIYNYTPRTVYAKHWTPETLACRGLVLDSHDEVVLRPFGKFFNAGELDEMPTGFHHTYEKMDGSLFLVGTWRERVITATRGSFTSPQADLGRELLDRTGDPLPIPGITYCLELIHPQNRIVVDYGVEERLVFLAAIDNSSGRTIADFHPLFDSARRYDAARYTQMLSAQDRIRNMEGFVLHFPETDQRVKIKFEEYVRLHRILTGVNARHIWERLASGQLLDDLLELVPDEFYQWVRETDLGLNRKFAAMDRSIKTVFGAVQGRVSSDRREFAAMVAKYPEWVRPALFNLYDGKPIDQIIWKRIRPEASSPFRSDEP